MILFFDRSLGTAIPIALQNLKTPISVVYHDAEFNQNEPDDIWLPEVARRGWTVIGQDYYHLKPNELAAIKQHGVGCFYLWGAESTKWETMRVFARAYDKIVLAADTALRPFAYTVQKHGGLTELHLP